MNIGCNSHVAVMSHTGVLQRITSKSVGLLLCNRWRLMTPQLSKTLTSSRSLVLGQQNFFCTCGALESKRKRDRDSSMREVSASLSSRRLVKLINEEGALMGVMQKDKAREIAARRNLKLFCWDESCHPSVYKLMTGMEQYEETIRRRREKTRVKLGPEKIVKVSSKISGRDLLVKLKHVHEMIGKRHPVKFVSKTAADEDSQETLSTKQSKLFEQIRAEFSGVGKVTEASRKSTELTVMITPTVNESEDSRIAEES